jgi:hypothetical protein
VLPVCDRTLCDPQEGGKSRLSQAEPPPGFQDALGQGRATSKGEVPEEPGEPAEVPSPGYRPPTLPVQDRPGVHAELLGRGTLGEAKVNPTAPEVLAGRLGINRIPGRPGPGPLQGGVAERQHNPEEASVRKLGRGRFGRANKSADLAEEDPKP